MGDHDADNPLRERLRSRIEQKSEGADGSTDSKEKHGDKDDYDDDDEMEQNAGVPDAVEEAAQMIAESAEDTSPEQVVEMLSPLFGEDTRDDGQELAGEESVPDGVVTEEELDEKLDDLRDTVDEKLDDVVDGLAEETRDVIQKAEFGSTPSPSATSNGSGGVALFSDEADEGGDN